VSTSAGTAGGTDRLEVRATDLHTAGEPFRIVTSGVPPIAGSSVRDRRETARRDAAVDHVRRLLCHEPRGHADMYGCFLVEPDDAGADLGVLFWHNDGYSTACGHGTIALGAWAVEEGLVPAPGDGEVDVTIDVPSGRVVARVRRRAGATVAVTFRSVPSYVLTRDVPVTTSAGPVMVDVAYGGAIYACLPAASVGLTVAPEHSEALRRVGQEVKHAVDGTEVARHPTDDRLSGVYGTILSDDLGDTADGPHQRNVTVFADGQLDRSPCGSGTAARLALLDADGRLPADGVLRHDSIVGTTFLGRIVERTTADGLPAIVPEIEGMAYRTGEHRFLLDPGDPLDPGFVLR
jgi:proline racemase